MGSTERQEYYSDENYIYNDRNHKNILKSPNLNKRGLFSPKTNQSNLIRHQTNKKKENSIDYSNNNKDGNINEERNFLISLHDLIGDAEKNNNMNFQKELTQIQQSNNSFNKACFQNQKTYMNPNFPSPNFNEINYNAYNNKNNHQNNFNHINVNQNSTIGNKNIMSQDFNQAYNQNFNESNINRFNINLNNKNTQMQNGNNFTNDFNDIFHNQNVRNFPYISKNFKMENNPNSPYVPNYNPSTSCSYPDSFYRNQLVNNSDSENCNMVFNKNNFNHFYDAKNPYFNNINSDNNNYFNTINQNNFNMLRQVKNTNSTMPSNNSNCYNFQQQQLEQLQMNNIYNLEQGNNNNCFKFNTNFDNKLINSFNSSNSNFNVNISNSNNPSKGQGNKNKKNKNKNNVKTLKGFSNQYENILRTSFQSMEKNNPNKTFNTNITITNKANKFLNNSSRNLHSNNPFSNNQEMSSSHGSNLSGFSGYHYEMVDSSSCNLENSMKSFDINSKFQRAIMHSDLSEANNDSNSKDSSFSSEKKIEINSSCGLKKSGKNTSGNAINKKSLFNKDKKEPLKEMKEDLITFLLASVPLFS